MWFFFFFKQKTAYEMRISDWSSDVCSSDLHDHDGESEDIVYCRYAGPLLLLFKRIAQYQVGEVHQRANGRTVQFRIMGQGAPQVKLAHNMPVRSEERCVGQECDSSCKSRWSPDL